MARMRNRVRIPPSPVEVARAEEALRWPVRFSPARNSILARAVNLGAPWVAFDADIDARVKRLKITRRAFHAWKLQGLANYCPRAGPAPGAGAVNARAARSHAWSRRFAKALVLPRSPSSTGRVAFASRGRAGR